MAPTRFRLVEHLDRNREALLAYSRIAEVVKHKTIIGSTREALISAFLSQNLPKFIEYYTGEIFDSNDLESGQIDIILHPITSPKLHLYNSINLFPAETVLAAIEIKSTLNKQSLLESLGNCEKVKKLSLMSPKNSPSTIDSQTIPYIVFAFESFKKTTTITEHMKNWINNKKERNFRHLPDMIVSIEGGNKGYCLEKVDTWYQSNLKISDLYKEIKENPLYPLFTFLIKIFEIWSSNPNKFAMPSELYIPRKKNDFF